jgi:hypothetical protein
LAAIRLTTAGNISTVNSPIFPIPNSTTKMADLTPQERFEMITKNLQEVLNPEIIEEIVVKQNKPLIVYWGNIS